MTDPFFDRFGLELSADNAFFHEGEPGEAMYAMRAGPIQVSSCVGCMVQPFEAPHPEAI